MVLSKLGRFAWQNYPNVRRFSSKYQKALEKYPILMQAIQVKQNFNFNFCVKLNTKQILKLVFFRVLHNRLAY